MSWQWLSHWNLLSYIGDLSTWHDDRSRYFFFPGDNGQVQLIDSQEPIDETYLKDVFAHVANTTYYIYTRDNRDNPEALTDVTSDDTIIEGSIDYNKETVFVVHGWQGDSTSLINVLLTDALLKISDVNVIVVDWGVIAKNNYVTAKHGVYEVGKSLGEFINQLNGLGLSYDKIHLIGFSLGGHLVGVAARTTGSKVKRITGLDPARPLFVNDPERLAPTDAKYVEIIHTNAGIFGFLEPCGQADFYPNGGTRMPGCFRNSCSHSISYEYMASSIVNNHLQANSCKDQVEAKSNKCTGDLEPMGNSFLNKTLSGIYRVNTKKKYPF